MSVSQITFSSRIHTRTGNSSDGLPVWQVSRPLMWILLLFDFDYDHNLLLIRTEFCCRYFSKLFEITSYLPNVHVYADGTQLYISFSPNDIDEQMNTLFAIEDCVAAIRSWMSEDKLKLNDDKTEFLLVGTKQQLAKVCIKDIKVGCVEISSSSVRNFGL